MKKLIYTFVLVLITNFALNIENCNAQWIQQNSGVTDNLVSIKMINSSTGYVLSQGYKLLKTTNGGTNWNIVYQSGQSFTQISFPNANTGYAVTGSKIYKTTNGGLNFDTYTDIFTSSILKDVQFINADTGYVSGTYYYSMTPPHYELFMYKTTNGGQTYVRKYYDWFNHAYTMNVFFLNANTGWLSISMLTLPGPIYKTTNGGDDFTSCGTPLTSAGQAQIFFLNPSTGWVVGQVLFSQTIDGGQSWNALTSPWVVLKDVYFNNENTGYLVGNNESIYKTTNAGLNWVTQLNPGVTKITFTDINTGWAIGYSGKIYKTTNGGTVFVNNNCTEIPEKYSLSQNYPNPFNPTTNIKFSIIKTEQVKLIVYDVQGREVQTLVNQRLQPGTYEVTFNIESATEHRRTFGSGVYFYKLITDGFSETKRMLLIK